MYTRDKKMTITIDGDKMKIQIDKKELEEQEMYQFVDDEYEQSLKFVEVFLDSFINASNPYMEFLNDNMICIDKYNIGRDIVLQNCEYNDWDKNDDNEVIEYEKFIKALDVWINQLKEEIIDKALEYIEDNEIGLRC